MTKNAALPFPFNPAVRADVTEPLAPRVDLWIHVSASDTFQQPLVSTAGAD